MPRPRTIVVGAGLSGLACALDLLRAGHDVLVLEASARCGGVVDTIERDGFRFETGPHSVPASSAAFVQLCADLGLEHRLVIARGGPRWLWFQGRLVALPASLPGWLSTPLLSRQAKLGLLSEPLRRFRPPPAGAPEPTFEAFLTERLGPEPTRRLAGAFVRGIYAAEIGELGARSAFPRLWGLAERHGSLFRGLVHRRLTGRKRPPAGPSVPAARPMSLLSFPRGLVELVEALEHALAGCIRTQSPVDRLERLESGWTVVSAAGNDRLATRQSAFADHVVLCVPAPVAASLLAPAAGPGIDLAFLRSIRHASVTVVHLGFAHGVELPRGFGYLVPPDADDRGPSSPRALGTIFASNLFDGRAPAGGSSVASFYRGVDVVRLDAARLVQLAIDDLRLALGADTLPPAQTTFIRRWSDVIPRYEPEHDRRADHLLAALREREPGLHLGGASMGGVSVDAVIARGRAVAREVLFQEQYA